MSAQRAPGTAGSSTGDSGTYELYGDTLIRLDGGGGGSTTGDFISLGLNDVTNTYGGGSYADANQGGMLTQQQSYGINPGTGREYSQAAIDRYTAWNPASTADGVITPEEWAAYQLSFGANSDRWDSGWAADPNNYQTLKNALATGIQSLSGTQKQQVQAMYDQIYGATPAEQPNYGYRPGDNKAFTQDNYTRISRDGGDANNDGTISADEWVTWMLNKGADAGYEQQWADKMAAAAGSGMLSSAVQQQVEQAMYDQIYAQPSGGSTGSTGGGIVVGGATPVDPGYVGGGVINQNPGDTGYQDTVDDTWWHSSAGDPAGADEIVPTDVVNVYNQLQEILAQTGIDFTGTDWESLNPSKAIAAELLLKNISSGAVDPSTLDPSVFESLGLISDESGDIVAAPDDGNVTQDPTTPEYPAEWESVINDLISGNNNINTIEEALAHIEYVNTNFPDADTNSDGVVSDQEWADYNDLTGDGDLEDGGAFFDPPPPRSPTGEWQWNTETQDYDWVEGTQEATILDEGSWTDDIRNAAGSITDKITDYILSQKPPSVSAEDWMKSVLPNPSISVVQGGPDNTNIWIKLPGPLGDGLIDLEAIKNGEFTLDDAIKGKLDDAAEAIKGIPGAIQEKASTIFEEIKSAGKNIGDIFEQDGNIFAKILDASGEIIDTIEISVGEIAGGWYTPSDAGWLLGDIIEILGEEFKYDGAPSDDTETETGTETETEEPAGGDSSDGDSSTGDDTDSSGDGSTDNSGTSDGSGDGSSVPGGNETNTSDNDASEEPAGGDTGDSSGGTTIDSKEEDEPAGGSTGDSTDGIIDDSSDDDDDLSSGGGGNSGVISTPIIDDGGGIISDEPVGGGGSSGGGSISGGGGGGNGRQGGMFTGGIGVDYSPLQSVIYKVGDPMVELERMISKSLFKDMM